MIFQVVYILANQLTTFSLTTTTANTTLGNAFAHFLGASGVPVVTNVTADAGQAGSSILTAFVNTALGIIEGIIKSAPLYIFQLFIVTLLVWYLLVNGDHIVAEFKSLAPRNHRGTVNTFLGHLNSIYHALYVNYILAGVISGIIALFFFPIIGVPYAFTCAFLMLTIGIIPIIGRALIYVPVSLYFAVIGDPIKALLVLIASIVIFQHHHRYLPYTVFGASRQGGHTETRCPARVRYSVRSARPCRGHYRAGGVRVCPRAVPNLPR